MENDNIFKVALNWTLFDRINALIFLSVALCLIAFIGVIPLLPGMPDYPWWVACSMISMSVITLCICLYLLRGLIPMQLRFEGAELILTEKPRPLRISLNDVVEVRFIHRSYVVDGVDFLQRPRGGAYMGRYKHKYLGRTIIYAFDTSMDKLILLRTKDGAHYIFGCTCIDELMKRIRSRISNQRDFVSHN